MITLVVTMLVAGPAQARDTSVITAAFNNPEKANVLRVLFEGDTTVKTVKATLKPVRQADRPSIEVTQFTLTREGINTTADSAPVAADHYDQFTVVVEATDTDGNQLAARDPEFYAFNWLIRPTIELTATPAAVDVDHQRAKITAVFTGAKPMGEPVGVLANRTVHMGLSGDVMQTLTTDAQGKAAVATDPPSARAPRNYVAEINWSSVDEADLAGGSNFVPLAVRPVGTRLSAKAEPARVLKGKRVKVSGTLERKSGNAWKPLAGQQVKVGTTQVKTDAAGRYETRYVVQRTETPVAQYGLNDLGADTELWYVGSERPAGQVVVPVATSFSQVKVQVDAKGKVEASGSFRGGNPAVKAPEVQLEFSPNGTGGWVVKKALKVRSGRFATTLQHRRAGYWRVVFKGDLYHLRGVSRVHKAWRWGTWISPIKASPTRVRLGGTTTVSGTLTRKWTQQQPRPTAFPNQNVRIIFRFRGQSTWYHLGWARTNRSGQFAGRVTANGDGFYAVAFAGTNDTWAADSPNKVYVDTYR